MHDCKIYFIVCPLCHHFWDNHLWTSRCTSLWYWWLMTAHTYLWYGVWRQIVCKCSCLYFMSLSRSVYTYAYVSIYMYDSKSVCIHVCLCVCLYTRLQVCICICLYTCMFLCMLVYMFVFLKRQMMLQHVVTCCNANHFLYIKRHSSLCLWQYMSAWMCLYRCLYVCLHVSLDSCMFVCLYV